LQQAADSRGSLAEPIHASATALTLSSKYTFDGVRFVLDDSKAAICTLSFANVRNDLLAFANCSGELWFAELPPLPSQDRAAADINSLPIVVKAPKIHVKVINSMDWSFDNSQLLTAGDDGAICIWDTQAATCIRSISILVPILCARFHRLNPNLAAVGTSSGLLELYNCSAGTLHQKCHVAGAFQKDLQVTAVAISNHHVFAGDSYGFVHLYRCEMQDGSVHRLVWHSKLHVTASHKSPVHQVEYVPFCRSTDTPVLLCSCRDGTIAIVSIHEKHHRMELHSRCAAPPMARNMRIALCPLSIIQDMPRITSGSEDTNVYIYNVTSGGSKPSVVNTLKGHRAPVVDVSFSFDETLLATADCDGTVIIWHRSMVPK